MRDSLPLLISTKVYLSTNSIVSATVPMASHFVPMRCSCSAVNSGGVETHDSMKLNIPTSKIKSNVLIRIMPPIKENGDTGIYENSGMESNFI